MPNTVNDVLDCVMREDGAIFPATQKLLRNQKFTPITRKQATGEAPLPPPRAVLIERALRVQEKALAEQAAGEGEPEAPLSESELAERMAAEADFEHVTFEPGQESEPVEVSAEQESPSLPPGYKGPAMTKSNGGPRTPRAIVSDLGNKGEMRVFAKQVLQLDIPEDMTKADMTDLLENQVAAVQKES